MIYDDSSLNREAFMFPVVSLDTGEPVQRLLGLAETYNCMIVQ